ncbi:MAG: hypothetical protein WBA22_01385 [Candidatus Methanofastidiosia archaeon]
MKAISLNKKLWTDVAIGDLDFVSPDCDVPLVTGCGSIPCPSLCPLHCFTYFCIHF